MYFLALAADYDGTLAKDGSVSPDTGDALRRLKRAGRRLLLVTGRRLPSLARAFPDLALFDRIVAENGAVLFDPVTRQETAIAPPPSPQLVDALNRRGVTPLHVGSSIIATWEPHDRTVLDEIKKLGMELQIIFNKGAVMVLPPGVNKASGLAHALRELGISAKNVVAVGDAENDHAFLRACGCGAAVGNALPAIKEDADIRLVGSHGQGVVELVGLMLDEEAPLAPPAWHDLLVGTDGAGSEIRVSGRRGSLLVTGKSGVGKSTLATALTERMVEGGFNFCIFDPEGDYSELDHSVSVGDARSPPVLDEAMSLISKVSVNVVVNAQALSLADRPQCFDKLLPRLLSLRASSGQPHWIIVDEAHHQMDAARTDLGDLLPARVRGLVFITVHPEAMSARALQSVETIVALGDTAPAIIESFCTAIGEDAPRDMPTLVENEVLLWERSSGRPPFAVKAIHAKQARERHKTKYAEGELDPDRSFFFRGPNDKLNLRAQNLMIFLQIAEGIDSETWEHHRRLGDYSAWFQRAIKDEQLANEASAIEQDGSLDARESLERIAQVVRARYTVSAVTPRNWREEQAAKPTREQ